MKESKISKEDVKNILNEILRKKEGRNEIQNVRRSDSLTKDIGMSSFDLAEMTVRIEDKYGVDVFQEEVVDTVGEVVKIVKNKKV